MYYVLDYIDVIEFENMIHGNYFFKTTINENIRKLHE